MALTSLLLLALLSAAPAQTTPGATIRTAGHTYQLFCTREGELIQASETGLCEKTDEGGIQHFEVRNENDEVQFSQDATGGSAFSFVALFGVANAGREILDVETSQNETAASDPKAAHTIYYFDPLSTRLIPFDPPLVGVDGFAHVDSGLALSRTFDTGFFQFSVLLNFNVATHRIEVMADQTAFSAFPPPGRQKPAPAAGSGDLRLYSSHDLASAKTVVRIAPGHSITWWQSPDIGDKPSAGQIVTILSAWAPASLKQADNAPDGVKMVYYDWNNLWLQIQVEDHAGWIKGPASFRTLGLQMNNSHP